MSPVMKLSAGKGSQTDRSAGIIRRAPSRPSASKSPNRCVASAKIRCNMTEDPARPTTPESDNRSDAPPGPPWPRVAVVASPSMASADGPGLPIARGDPDPATSLEPPAPGHRGRRPVPSEPNSTPPEHPMLLASSLVLVVASALGQSGEKWEVVTSPEGKFTVEMPAKPNHSNSSTSRGPNGKVTVHEISCTTPEGIFLVSRVEDPVIIPRSWKTSTSSSPATTTPRSSTARSPPTRR